MIVGFRARSIAKLAALYRTATEEKSLRGKAAAVIIGASALNANIHRLLVPAHPADSQVDVQAGHAASEPTTTKRKKR